MSGERKLSGNLGRLKKGMRALTDLQITKQGGKPAFAVIPYDAYLELIALQSQAHTDDHGDQTTVAPIVKTIFG